MAREAEVRAREVRLAAGRVGPQVVVIHCDDWGRRADRLRPLSPTLQNTLPYRDRR